MSRQTHQINARSCAPCCCHHCQPYSSQAKRAKMPVVVVVDKSSYTACLPKSIDKYYDKYILIINKYKH